MGGESARLTQKRFILALDTYGGWWGPLEEGCTEDVDWGCWLTEVKDEEKGSLMEKKKHWFCWYDVATSKIIEVFNIWSSQTQLGLSIRENTENGLSTLSYISHTSLSCTLARRGSLFYSLGKGIIIKAALINTYSPSRALSLHHIHVLDCGKQPLYR